MIQAEMKEYNYYTCSDTNNSYGQPTIDYSNVAGTVKMSINILSQAISTSSLYKDCSYLGLTYNKAINEKCVIEYSEQSKLKVQYVNPQGRYIQVFLKQI